MQKSGFVHHKCAKCGGSLYLDSDSFGWYEQCLQCGRISDLQRVGQVKEISSDTIEAEQLTPAK